MRNFIAFFILLFILIVLGCLPGNDTGTSANVFSDLEKKNISPTEMKLDVNVCPHLLHSKGSKLIFRHLISPFLALYDIDRSTVEFYGEQSDTGINFQSSMFMHSSEDTNESEMWFLDMENYNLYELEFHGTRSSGSYFTPSTSISLLDLAADNAVLSHYISDSLILVAKARPDGLTYKYYPKIGSYDVIYSPFEDLPKSTSRYELEHYFLKTENNHIIYSFLTQDKISLVDLEGNEIKSISGGDPWQNVQNRGPGIPPDSKYWYYGNPRRIGKSILVPYYHTESDEYDGLRRLLLITDDLEDVQMIHLEEAINHGFAVDHESRVLYSCSYEKENVLFAYDLSDLLL